MKTEADDQKRISIPPLESSVVSYPTRGPWGNPRFRGNADGTLTAQLILKYRARRIADPMCGSDTTGDVVRYLKQSGVAIDGYLRNDLQDPNGRNLEEKPLPQSFDLVWLHPPYWNMIRYSTDPRDLSTAATYDEFCTRLYRCLKNAYQGLLPGGRMAVLVGDIRRGGSYYSMAKSILDMADSGALGEHRATIVKVQHNCTSDRRAYSGLEDPRIAHEFCLVFKRPEYGLN